MIKRAIAVTVLAAAAFAVAPGTAQAQANPALIGQGAVTWGNNCGRCHHARPTAERSDAEWLVIVLHMRARANLTRTQAMEVLSYLQATNTPTASGDAAAAASDAERQAAPAAKGEGPPDTTKKPRGEGE